MYRRNRDFVRYSDRGLLRKPGNYREIFQLAVIFSNKVRVLKTRIAKLRSSHQRNIIRFSRSREDCETVSVTHAPIVATAFRPKPSGSDRRKTFISWNVCAARNSLGDDNWQIMAYNVGSEARQTNGN